VTSARVPFAVAALILVAASCGGTGTATDGPLSEGDRAPDFTLPSASGETVALSDFAGKKPVLLYFSMGPG
jgi:hypothetical protein